MVCLYSFQKKGMVNTDLKNDLLKGVNDYNEVGNQECSQGAHNARPTFGFTKTFLGSLKFFKATRLKMIFKKK